jgi:hypothetical protein
MQQQTNQKRAEQRRREWAELEGWCMDGARTSRTGFPLPPLAFAQLEATIAELQVSTLYRGASVGLCASAYVRVDRTGEL